jgi:hypothetical protein
VQKKLDTKESTMNVSLRKRLFVSAVALVGLTIVLGQMSVFAQARLKQQIVNGGFFQVIDSAIAPCTGQCAIANWQTATCNCPPDFSLVQIGRTLISVGSGEEGSICGATLYTCVLPAQ